MAVVPIDGFPQYFQPHCPKCESTNLHFQRIRHPFMWGASEVQMSCYICGTVKYGEPAIRQVLEPQLATWDQRQQEAQDLQAALERERVERREREAREREEYKRQERERHEAVERRRERLKVRREAFAAATSAEPPVQVTPPVPEPPVPEPPVVGKECAWHECSQPARPNSLYCSRVCNNRNAHARDKARKMAARAEGAASTPAPLPSKLRDSILARKAQYEARA